MIRPVVRVALAVLGLAAVVYGTASLTGGWLGTPPWWERAAPMSAAEWAKHYTTGWDIDRYLLFRKGWFLNTGSSPIFPSDEEWADIERSAAQHVDPVAGREWISGGVVAAGLALAALGAWPRRRRADAER